MPDDVTPQDESFENDAAEDQDANTPSVDQVDSEEGQEPEADEQDMDSAQEEPQEPEEEGGSSVDDDVERQMLEELQNSEGFSEDEESSDEVSEQPAVEQDEESIDDLVEKQMLAELEKMDSDESSFDDESSHHSFDDSDSGGMFDSPEVQKAEFQQLTGGGKSEPQNLDLLLDVDLPLSIELGRTKMKVQEILNLGPGSVVELNKLAGEPVDLLVNNKIVAKGEVVVIDENFGLRITSLVSPQERIKSLGE